MARMIGRAEGFALGIAVANTPSLRREVVEQIRKLCLGREIRELELDRPVTSLLGAIEKRFGFGRKLGVLFVYGLEHSMRGGEEYAPIFGNLNLTRNLFPEKCPYPLVLWLPQYAVARLSRYAPDFFSWRSGSYTFSLEAGEFQTYVGEQLKDLEGFDNLPVAEKEDRIVALEEVLRRLRELPDDRRVLDERSYVLLASGNLHILLGNYERAAALYSEALEISQASGNRATQAISLHQLGIIAQRRGDLREAERLYRESLAIKVDLGDPVGQAATSYHLGRVAEERGDLAAAVRLYRESLASARSVSHRHGEATTLQRLGVVSVKRGNLAEGERLCREALTIRRSLGDRAGEGGALHNLGNIVKMRGDLAEAERLYRESLAIARSLGERAGEAASLHQLGTIAEERGDLAEAERLYRESLAIARSLGERAGEAASLHQLGKIAQKRGDLREAERLYRESLAIAENTGLRDGEIAQRSLERIASQGRAGAD